MAVTPKTVAVGVAATVGIIAAGMAATVGRKRIAKASTDVADAVKSTVAKAKAALPEAGAKEAKPRRARKGSNSGGSAA